jgi:Fe2+ or Zn2+ uptake regulation protein
MRNRQKLKNTAEDREKAEFGEGKSTVDARMLLRMHGLIGTPTRIAILQLFDTARRPLSAQEVIAAFTEHQRKKTPEDQIKENWNEDDWEDGKKSYQRKLGKLKSNVDETTVYRIIKLLNKQGVIKQIDLRHNHAHYELANMREHHHIICLKCGKLEDVDKCGVQDMQVRVLNQSKHFAKINEHALEFYGICKACVSKGGTL